MLGVQRGLAVKLGVAEHLVDRGRRLVVESEGLWSGRSRLLHDAHPAETL